MIVCELYPDLNVARYRGCRRGRMGGCRHKCQVEEVFHTGSFQRGGIASADWQR